MQTLEYREFYPEVFLRILAKIVKKFGTFASKGCHIRSRLIDTVVEGFVRYQSSDRAFAGLSVGQDRFDSS